jgi:hypothetical protein
VVAQIYLREAKAVELFLNSFLKNNRLAYLYKSTGVNKLFNCGLLLTPKLVYDK